jgi:hypothetical protein
VAEFLDQHLKAFVRYRQGRIIRTQDSNLRLLRLKYGAIFRRQDAQIEIAYSG